MPTNSTFFFNIPTQASTTAVNPSPVVGNPFDNTPPNPTNEEYLNIKVFETLTESPKPKVTANDFYTKYLHEMLDKLNIKSPNFDKKDLTFPKDARNAYKTFKTLADLLHEWKTSNLEIQEEDDI